MVTYSCTFVRFTFSESKGISLWNNVSNKNATTVEKLAQGYSRAASVAKTWGMDMHELNAVIGM